MRKLVIVIAVVVAVLVGLVFFPWQQTLKGQLQAALEGVGFSRSEFSIAAFTPQQLTLNAIALEKSSLVINAESLDLQGDVGVTSLLADKKWQGKWELKNLQLTGGPAPLPPLSGKGELSVSQLAFSLSGELGSDDKTHRLTTKMHYAFGQLAESYVKLDTLKFPWQGGTIALVSPVELKGVRTAPVSVTLDVSQVPLSDLLALLTQQRATATGVVSGRIPLQLMPDNTIKVQNASLQTQQPGTIAIQPDVIPGASPELELVRQIVSNFHYSQLSIKGDSKEGDKLSMLLSLSGNNPALYNGQAINLNVNLQGDMIQLLQGSILPLNDVRAWLEKGSYEK
jgi:hypothetical protein